MKQLNTFFWLINTCTSAALLQSPVWLEVGPRSLSLTLIDLRWTEFRLRRFKVVWGQLMSRQTEAAGGWRWEEDGDISPETLINEWKWSARKRNERTKGTSEGQSEKHCLREVWSLWSPSLLRHPPSSCVHLVPYYRHVKGFWAENFCPWGSETLKLLHLLFPVKPRWFLLGGGYLILHGGGLRWNGGAQTATLQDDVSITT